MILLCDSLKYLMEADNRCYFSGKTTFLTVLHLLHEMKRYKLKLLLLN